MCQNFHSSVYSINTLKSDYSNMDSLNTKTFWEWNFTLWIKTISTFDYLLLVVHTLNTAYYIKNIFIKKDEWKFIFVL